MARRKKKSARELVLEQQIAEFDRLATAAESAEHFSAAVAARAAGSKLRSEIARLHADAEAAAARTPLERVRVLRNAATQDGSWVAAAQLAKAERALEQERDELARAQVKAPDLSPDEALAELLDVIGGMSPVHLARLRDECIRLIG
jgi:hypothetical protein